MFDSLREKVNKTIEDHLDKWWNVEFDQEADRVCQKHRIRVKNMKFYIFWTRIVIGSGYIWFFMKIYSFYVTEPELGVQTRQISDGRSEAKSVHNYVRKQQISDGRTSTKYQMKGQIPNMRGLIICFKNQIPHGMTNTKNLMKGCILTWKTKYQREGKHQIPNGKVKH